VSIGAPHPAAPQQDRIEHTILGINREFESRPHERRGRAAKEETERGREKKGGRRNPSQRIINRTKRVSESIYLSNKSELRKQAQADVG
jgi:hypothetical protein